MMHDYLRAIGFSKIGSRRAMQLLISDVIGHYDYKAQYRTDEGRVLAEFSRDFAGTAGLTVCGEFDDAGNFHAEYAFPYYKATIVSAREEVDIERHASKESYAGALDDPRIDITVIFYLTNAGEYRVLQNRKQIKDGKKAVVLSGLAREGTVLLPVRTSRRLEYAGRKAAADRIRLRGAARDGDEAAIEELSLNDMDTYSMISERIEKEDVFSIVETYFMPCGLECDQYDIMGIIRQISSVQNAVSGEEMYQMDVLCNDMSVNVCINKKDLTGVPAPGRRFRGLIWLQGQVLFNA